MSLNAGQIYERNLFNLLKNKKLIPDNISSPESIPGQDVTVQNNNGQSGIEIKLELNKVDFGSATLGFDFAKKKWFLKQGTTQEYLVIKESIESVNLIKMINKKWYSNNSRKNYEPQYLEEERSNNSKAITSINRDLRGKVDQENLESFKQRINMDVIKNYYIAKGSYYIHIKGSGLYWLGTKDPLGIKDHLSEFNPSKCELLVRVQPKGSGIWRYAVTIKVSGLAKSKMNKGLDGDLSFLQ